MLSNIFKRALVKNKSVFMMPLAQKRGFQGHLGLDSTQDLVPRDFEKNDQVSLWKDRVAAEEKSLVLKSNDEIEKYVLSLVRNYFRTTKKASVALDCDLADHGLDSLDAIELVI